MIPAQMHNGKADVTERIFMKVQQKLPAISNKILIQSPHVMWQGLLAVSASMLEIGRGKFK
jgi:hypothetical protein